MAGANPIPYVTMNGVGVVNTFIPAAFVNQTTPQERVSIVESGGKIPDALDLNSTIAFSPNPVVLNAGDSKVMTLTISIPKSWPDAAVGQDIWYALNFQPLENYNLPDFQITQTGIQVHVVS